MAPSLSEDEIDDLIYLARAGEDAELSETITTLSGREGVTPAEILATARDESKATCLHMAAANGHLSTVTLILSHVPTPESASKSKEPSQGDEAKPVSYIDAQNEFGNSALHWACLGGHLESVKLLMDKGASPTVANDKDQIPLDLAAFNSHMEVVNWFLDQSKDIEGGNAKEGGLEKAAETMEVEEDGESAEPETSAP